jgi:hypothetical protein
MRRLLAAIAIAASSALVCACFIITGSTDGYSQAAAVAASTDAAVACAPDAACVAFTCVGTSDCDAGQVCCLGSSASALTSSCQVACLGPQFCKTDSDCDKVSCTSQSCTSNGVSLILQACGTLPGCTP